MLNVTFLLNTNKDLLKLNQSYQELQGTTQEANVYEFGQKKNMKSFRHMIEVSLNKKKKQNKFKANKFCDFC